MSAELVGQIVLGVVGVSGGLWAGYQLFHSFFGKFAKKEAVDAMKADVDTIMATMVTRLDFNAHTEQDREDRKERREAELSLFKKVDDLKDSMNDKFDSLKDLIVARLK